MTVRYHLSQSIDVSADRFPDSVAFRCQQQDLDYAGMSRLSNRLANALREQGVRRGDRVGIYCQKSLHSAIAVYGIMKSGAAYVPIDPHAPVQRIARILEQCGIRHLVSHPPRAAQVVGLLGSYAGLESVLGLPTPDLASGRQCCFTAWEEVEQLDGERPPAVRLTEQDLAYIMFTSGSTGAPKGIMHTHRSGLAYALLSADTYGLGRGDRLGNHSPLHFDMSTLEFLSGPLAGCTTIIIPEAHARLPASLSALAERERLTVWYSVPFALIQMLLRGALDERDLTSLRWVLFGGEPFPPKHLRALMDRWPQARFSNVYGPAEVNQCTFYHVPPTLTGREESIPIGTVWNNTDALLVDEQDRPVGAGEWGELLIRSPTMMRGYWKRPDLNARCFYRRPACSGVDDIFFRTGDIASVDAQGEYLYHGRKDRQIKVRGNRVELDEIEAVMLAHAEIEAAAAYPAPTAGLSPGDSAGGVTSIEVAVIKKQGSAASARELIRFAAQHLPGYAIPERIRFLEEFPLTATDKIDRRALQIRAFEGRESELEAGGTHVG
jgi:amino acid adenylation domain-containing protein